MKIFIIAFIIVCISFNCFAMSLPEIETYIGKYVLVTYKNSTNDIECLKGKFIKILLIKPEYKKYIIIKHKYLIHGDCIRVDKVMNIVEIK